MHRLNTDRFESALAYQETELASCATSQRNGSVNENILQINAKAIFKPQPAKLNIKDEEDRVKGATVPDNMNYLAGRKS